MNNKIYLLLIAFIVANILVLYFILFTINGRLKQVENYQVLDKGNIRSTSYDNEKSTSSSGNINTLIGPTLDCTSCAIKINEVENEISQLKNQIIQISSTPITTSVQESQNTTFQAIYIPLGSGEVKSNEWADVQGAAAYVDTANYSHIIASYFEGSLTIPTGQGRAYVRLYNVTDKHPVWFSEVSTETHETYVFQTDKIMLDSGNKLYQVQMKNTLKVRSTIDNARIKIIVQQ